MKRTRIMTKHLGPKTMPEFFENRFQSKSLKLASAAIVFVFLIPYTASVYNGLSRLFAMAFNLTSDASYMLIIVAMAVLTAIYVILGAMLQLPSMTLYRALSCWWAFQPWYTV